MPQAPKTLCLIQFWSWDKALFSLLALWGNKNWPPSMKVKKFETFRNKRGSTCCKWPNLNTPGTQTPQYHPIPELTKPNLWLLPNFPTRPSLCDRSERHLMWMIHLQMKLCVRKFLSTCRYFLGKAPAEPLEGFLVNWSCAIRGFSYKFIYVASMTKFSLQKMIKTRRDLQMHKCRYTHYRI